MITVFGSSECFVRGMFMSEIQLLYYTIPKVFNIYSHPVNVNALNIVASIFSH